jgi:hypothetical protein
MGREAQKKREEDGTATEADAAEQPQEVQIDPAAAALNAMIAFEDKRFLVQTVAVGPKDTNGMRELSFPVSPAKQVTLVLAPELQEHILKQLAGGIEIPDLELTAAVKAEADRAAAEKS